MRARLRATSQAFSAALRNPQLRRLQLAHALSDTAGWAGMTAISVYAYDVGGATLLGVSTFARMIPGIIVGPVLAAMADRGSRARMLAVTTAIRAAATAGTVLALSLDAPAAVVLGIPVLSMALLAAWYPAKAALVPALARSPEELTAANVLGSSIDSTSWFVGAAAAGVLLASSGVEVTFAAAAVVTLLAAVVLATLREPTRAVAPGEVTEEATTDVGLIAEAREGFAVVWRDSGLRLLVSLMALQLMVDGMLAVFIVALAFELLETGAGGVGALSSAIAAGGVVGVIGATALAGARRLAPTFLVGLLLWGLPLVVIGVAAQPLVALAMLALLGFGNTLLDVSGYTLVQRIADDRVMARVFGVYETSAIVTGAMGVLLAPLLLALTSVQAAFVITGAFLPVLALLSARAVIAADTPPAETVALLRGVDLFAPVDPSTIERLAAAATRHTYPAGARIVQQGDPGDRFYVIEQGEVEVHENGVRVRTESAGESFGEIALVRDTPRTATVTALSPTTVLGVDRERFLAALSETPLAGVIADRVAASRLGTARRMGMVPA